MKLHFRAARIDFSESEWVLTKVCIPQEEESTTGNFACILEKKSSCCLFPSTTTINVPVIFCHTDTEWNSWPLKNNEEILTIEWKKKWWLFLKRHRGRQIRYGTNINLVNSFSLTDLLPTSRHQTLMIFPKKSFYRSWSSLKKFHVLFDSLHCS